jgi:hypothetical protein
MVTVQWGRQGAFRYFRYFSGLSCKGPEWLSALGSHGLLGWVSDLTFIFVHFSAGKGTK